MSAMCSNLSYDCYICLVPICHIFSFLLTKIIFSLLNELLGDSSFNALNCPTHDRRYQQRIIDLLMATLLPAQTHWLQSIDNVFNCLADRYVLSVNSSYSVSAVNKQVS